MARLLACALLLGAGCNSRTPLMVVPPASQCEASSDCHKKNPDECNICPAGQTGLVCVNYACECACQAGSSCNDPAECALGYVCRNLDGGSSLGGSPGICLLADGGCLRNSDCAGQTQAACGGCPYGLTSVWCVSHACRCECWL